MQLNSSRLHTSQQGPCDTNRSPSLVGRSTPIPLTVPGYGTAHGCPIDALVSSTAPAANVTVKLADENATVKAHVSDIIEIQLPFGQK